MKGLYWGGEEKTLANDRNLLSHMIFNLWLDSFPGYKALFYKNIRISASLRKGQNWYDNQEKQMNLIL